MLVAVAAPQQILEAAPGRERLLHVQNVEIPCEDTIGKGMCQSVLLVLNYVLCDVASALVVSALIVPIYCLDRTDLMY